MLSILGGAAGLVLASWTLERDRRRRAAAALPRRRRAGARSARAGVHRGLAVLTGILFGLAPALQASKADVVPVLKNELVPSARGHRGLRGFLTLRQMLVVVAGRALARVAGRRAALFLRDLRHAQPIDTGLRDHAACWS